MGRDRAVLGPSRVSVDGKIRVLILMMIGVGWLYMLYMMNNLLRMTKGSWWIIDLDDVGLDIWFCDLICSSVT